MDIHRLSQGCSQVFILTEAKTFWFVHFSSVFSVEDLGSVPEVGAGPGGGDLFDMIASREKVRDLLRKLRADKAPGVDELSPRLLLHFPEEILDPVCMLFEKSLREGRVPEDWRRANVVLIYKAGDRGKAKNYRASESNLSVM